MSGNTPKEGRKAIMELIYKFDSTDRGVGNMVCGLHKNTGATPLDDDSVGGDVIPITGAGYGGEQTLTNASWNVEADGDSWYATLDFGPASGTWDGVYGWYIKTSTGKLLHFEYNASAPVAIVNGEHYRVDLSDILDF